MNDETKIKYELARIYENVSQINEFCDRYNYDYEKICGDILPYNAVSLELVLLGERLKQLKLHNKELFEDILQMFQKFIFMRDKLIHGYSAIDKNEFKEIVSKDVPFLREYIETEVIKEVLEDPYGLYEEEYELVV